MTNLASIVEGLAKQALGGGQNGQGSSGLGGVLGSVIGQLGNNNSNQNSSGLGGILGSVVGSLTNGNNNTQNTEQSGGGLNAQSILVAVVPLILSWIQQQGGLQAALDKLRGAGLTSQVQSWVDPSATGDQVSNSHVQGLFDDQDVSQVANETNSQKSDVYSAISTVLPQIINSLTPKGEQTDSQEANDDIKKVLSMVSGLIK